MVSVIFKFRLEKILSLRRREENLLKHEIFDIRNQILLMEEELSVIRKTFKEKAENFLNTLKKGLPGEKVKEFQLELLMWREREKEILKKIESLRKREEELLNVYKEKRMERKMMEKLKLRRYRGYLKDMDRLSRKYMDEVAERRHWWKSEG